MRMKLKKREFLDIDDLMAASKKIKAAYFISHWGHGCVALSTKKKHLDSVYEDVKMFFGEGRVFNIYMVERKTHLSLQRGWDVSDH